MAVKSPIELGRYETVGGYLANVREVREIESGKCLYGTIHDVGITHWNMDGTDMFGHGPFDLKLKLKP
ncbi:MAG: hypothetical protein V1900_01010 [Candidatus Aenigmatarchaeota archaeon]